MDSLTQAPQWFERVFNMVLATGAVFIIRSWFSFEIAIFVVFAAILGVCMNINMEVIQQSRRKDKS